MEVGVRIYLDACVSFVVFLMGWGMLWRFQVSGARVSEAHSGSIGNSFCGVHGAMGSMAHAAIFFLSFGLLITFSWNTIWNF